MSWRICGRGGKGDDCSCACGLAYNCEVHRALVVDGRHVQTIGDDFGFAAMREVAKQLTIGRWRAGR